jgi:HTH-type transcriptional regulator/antitoxin HipB
MKNTICDGGCKKGDCNGDCKRSVSGRNPVNKKPTKYQYPKGEIIGNYLQFIVLGEMIRKVRKEREMSRKDLSLLVGIKVSEISRIENRLQFARLDSIIKVFKALNLRMDLSIELPKETVILR